MSNQCPELEQVVRQQTLKAFELALGSCVDQIMARAEMQAVKPTRGVYAIRDLSVRV